MNLKLKLKSMFSFRFLSKINWWITCWFEFSRQKTNANRCKYILLIFIYWI